MKPTWSWSVLNQFETCPAQYAAERVYRTIKRQDNEASIWGNEVHGAIEHRLRTGEPLAERFKTYEKVATVIDGVEGDKFYEEQMALNVHYRPVMWMAKDVWVRGIIDVLIVNGDTAMALDWKTGKRKVNTLQLQLFALLTFAHFPDVQRISTIFQWLQTGQSDQEVYNRSELEKIWVPFLDKYRVLKEAYSLDIWTPKPSGLCIKHCAHKECEYHGVGNRR